MTDRPIIFSGPMVKALIAGRKSQTRRLASSPLRFCQPGDRLYVRENFWHRRDADGLQQIGWAVDFEWPGAREFQLERGYRLRPSIHMPRWASRISLLVESVRIEPLQSISGEDARAEGIEIPRCGCEICARSSRLCPADASEAIMAYAELWDQLHGAGEWGANPDVLVLSFLVADENIDELAA